MNIHLVFPFKTCFLLPWLHVFSLFKAAGLWDAVPVQTQAQHGYGHRIGGGKQINVCVLQIEQVSQLAALVQAQLEYHSRSSEILQQLSSKMEDRYRSVLPPRDRNKTVKINLRGSTQTSPFFFFFLQDKRSIK